MARFVYKMQSVLNIKQQTENQTKMEFAVAQAELNKQLDILEEYITRRDNYLKEAEELRNEDSLKLQDILDSHTSAVINLSDEGSPVGTDDPGNILPADILDILETVPYRSSDQT